MNCKVVDRAALWITLSVAKVIHNAWTSHLEFNQMNLSTLSTTPTAGNVLVADNVL